ncbi:MAG TPA: hypothetical protein VLF66_01435, partial [Thermoanaerobaculia bacterium]|nr:hypothetical protein [Thermoanaerobaculia bacterium]
ARWSGRRGFLGGGGVLAAPRFRLAAEGSVVGEVPESALASNALRKRPPARPPRHRPVVADGLPIPAP